MIVTTPEELQAFRDGDAGRCSATFAIPGPLGASTVLRCHRTAWHRDSRGHRHDHAEGGRTRWPGHGNFASTPFVEVPRTLLA